MEAPMLDGMRKASQGVVGKAVMTVVMGLIIVSFAVWGVGDMLRGFTSTTVAKVGSVSISQAAFANAVQAETFRLQRQLRQPLTPQQARSLGVDGQVLDRMIDEAALNERARSLGLAISDESIAAAVRDDPDLKGLDGRFDRNRFDEMLREAGTSERDFFRDQRDVYLRQQLEYALAGGIVAPKPLVEALQATQNETREIAYFILPPTAGGDVPPPGDDAMKAYFESRKANWRAPEYRTFDALVVTPTSLAKPAEVSDDDARAQYDKDREARYTAPETRKLQQIVYPTEADANEAEAKLKGGASFDDLAKARNLSAADLDLGEITKKSAFDAAVADAAFALPEAGVSAPVKGAFGYALIRVVAVKPETVKGFDAVKDAIRQEIAAGRAAAQVQGLHDKIEEAKAAGKTVAEAAKSVGLEARAYLAVDRDGLNAAGADANVPDKAQLLPAVFASDVGVDDEAIATKDRGFVWFSVTKIDPSRERSFEDVKDKVAAAWTAEERAKRLAEASAEAVKKLEAGGDIAELAKAAGAEVKTARDIRRAGGAGLAPEVAAAVFAVGPTGAGAAAAEGGRLVFKVTADKTPASLAADPATAGLIDRLKSETGSALVEQYVGALKRELGVSIDQRVMRGAEGG
jgi:peptidyl-prolyl cis-trans isomerase D